MPHAKVNGIDIHYRLEGEGPETLVLVNGLGDDLESWAFQMEDLLAGGLRTLRFDNRGIGGSSRPAGPYTTKAMAEDALALIDHLRLAPAHLLGLSMGGMIAQEMALARGEGVRSLVLAATYAAPGLYCTRMFRMWDDMARAGGMGLSLRDVLLHCFTPRFFADEPALAEEYEKAFAAIPMTTESYRAQVHAIITHDTSARLARLSAPTLVLAGEEDVLIPVELSRALSRLIPGAEFKTLPGAHAFLWEQPKPFNRAVLEFIARRRAPQS